LLVDNLWLTFFLRKKWDKVETGVFFLHFLS